MSNSPHDPLLHEREPTWKKTVAKQIIEIEKLKSDLADLRAWKESALEVEKSWDCQAVGTLLGLPLGSDIRAGIEPAIHALRADKGRFSAVINHRWNVWFAAEYDMWVVQAPKQVNGNIAKAHTLSEAIDLALDAARNAAVNGGEK